MNASTRPSVLLISDNRPETEAVVSALEPLDVDLIEIGSEERKLSALQGRDFAVIVCSLSDASADECAVADRVRRHGADEKTPILFLTSAVQEEQLLRCNDKAPVDVLLKPYDPAELRMRIRLFAEFHDMREDLETRIQERAKALGGAEERLWLLLENFEDYAIFTMDREGRVTAWNPGAARVLG